MEQIVGRFIGETERQLGTHHTAKQMFRWLGEEANGNGGGWEVMRKTESVDGGRKNELIHRWKDSEASLAIPRQPARWAKCFPPSHGLRRRFCLARGFSALSSLRSNAFDLLIISLPKREVDGWAAHWFSALILTHLREHSEAETESDPATRQWNVTRLWQKIKMEMLEWFSQPPWLRARFD